MAEDNNNNESENIHNPNIIINSNNNLYSYELDNYIVKINNHSNIEKFIKNILQKKYTGTQNNIVAIFTNYKGNINISTNNISTLITFNLITNATQQAEYLADIWNCRANILITFITNDDILHDYTFNHYLNNARPSKINKYTHQKLTIVFDPHKQSTSSNHPNPVNPHANNIGAGLYN